MSNCSTSWKEDFVLFFALFSCVQYGTNPSWEGCANVHMTCLTKLKMRKKQSFKSKLRKEKLVRKGNYLP